MRWVQVDPREVVELVFAFITLLNEASVLLRIEPEAILWMQCVLQVSALDVGAQPVAQIVAPPQQEALTLNFRHIPFIQCCQVLLDELSEPVIQNLSVVMVILLPLPRLAFLRVHYSSRLGFQQLIHSAIRHVMLRRLLRVKHRIINNWSFQIFVQ